MLKNSFRNDRLIHAECKKKKKSIIPWKFSCVEILFLMAMQFLLGICLRVNIRIVIVEILESFENYE